VNQLGESQDDEALVKSSFILKIVTYAWFTNWYGDANIFIIINCEGNIFMIILN